jgi:hypothetical protein
VDHGVDAIAKFVRFGIGERPRRVAENNSDEQVLLPRLET